MSDNNIVVKAGLLYAEQIAHDVGTTSKDKALALLLLAHHAATHSGLSKKQVENAAETARKIAEDGFGLEVALLSGTTSAATIDLPMPSEKAQEVSLSVLSAVYDGVPSEIMEGLSLTDLIDSLCLSLVHFAKSLDVSVPMVNARVGVCNAVIELQLSLADRQEAIHLN